jgi:hypothetical protein
LMAAGCSKKDWWTLEYAEIKLFEISWDLSSLFLFFHSFIL